PIIAVYGVNDMAPWGHMYVNPGLTEPSIFLISPDNEEASSAASSLDAIGLTMFGSAAPTSFA
ncbi:hypothetical protein ABG987_08555, partial [Collinsella aerofaciens]